MSGLRRRASWPSTAPRPASSWRPGRATASLLDAIDWPAGYRHGETLLPAIDALLGRLAIERGRLAAIVVGTGPGAFTGLRVGIATAKGIAHALDRPIIGIPTGEALLAGAPDDAVLLLPAGPSDRLVVRRGSPARLVAGEAEDAGSRPATTVLALDLPGRAPEAALARGEAARARARGQPAPSRRGAAGGRRHRRPRPPRAGLRDAAAGRPLGCRGGVVVARPPMILRIEPMRVEDLPAVHAIEKASFDAPWPPEAYRNDLETNRLAQYLVARIGDEIAGLRRDVADGRRGPHHHLRGPSRTGAASGSASGSSSPSSTSRSDRGAHEATLEVRLSNLPARRLYEKFGFRPVGLRPRYYSDNGEDALIMTTEPLADPAMRERIARLRAAVDAAPAPRRPGDDAT